MSDFSNIIAEINTNLPDNNTQQITAKKLRDTLIDLTDVIDENMDDFESNINQDFSDLSTQIQDDFEHYQDDIDLEISTFETNVENQLSSMVVDSLESSSTTKALSANMGNNLKKRCYRFTINGGDNTIKADSIFCFKDHKYLIMPDHTDVSFTGVTYTSSTYVLFGIYSKNVETDTKTTLYYRGCDNKTSPLSSKYTVVSDTNGELIINMRATTGEIINFYIEDITELDSQIDDFESQVNTILNSYSQVEVVDNLYSDSSTEALSAKQGKILSEEILGEITYDYDVDINIQYRIDVTFREVTTELSSYAITGKSFGVYYVNSEWYPDFVEGNRLYVKAGTNAPTYLMFLKQSLGAISAGSNETLQWLVDGDYLCSNHYNSVSHTWTSAIVIPAGEESYINIPQDCYRILIGLDTTYAQLEPCQFIKIGIAKREGGIVCEIQELDERTTQNSNDIEELYDSIYGEETSIENEVNFDAVSVKTGQLLSSSIVGSSSGINGRIWVVPVNAGDTLEITAQSDKGVYLCILNANPTIPSEGLTQEQTLSYMASNCTGYVPSGTSPYRMVIDAGQTKTINILANSDAKYVFVEKRFASSTSDLTPQLFKITSYEREGGIIDSIQTSSGLFLPIYSGNLDDNGDLIEDNTRVVTGFIINGNGFYMELKEGYQVERALLYDNNGKLASKNYYVHNTSGHNNTDNNCWGSNSELEQFLVRAVLSKNDYTEIGTDFKGIIKKFVYLNDSRLTKVIPENRDFYTFTTKANQLTNVVWKAVEKAEHNNGGSGTNRALWFLKDSIVIGVPYSGVGEYSKFIGIDVLFKTFLTATKNKRSVVYTEMIEKNTNISKYGLTYRGEQNYSGNFYGSICTGLYSYILSQPVCQYVAQIPDILGTNLRIAYGDLDENNNPVLKLKNSENVYETVTPDQLVANLQPMDLIWNTGHISIITDIYKDEFGINRYVVWTEQTGPCGRDIPYSNENFAKRLNYIKGRGSNWNIYRLSENAWNTDLTKPYEDTSKFIQNMFYDFTPEELEIDPDISTFEGEYPVFVINGNSDNTANYNNYKAFLNIHRNKGQYSTLEIFDENADVEQESPLRTIDISSNSGTYIYNSTNIYADDAQANDDWIILDLTQIPVSEGGPLEAGKYKARLFGSNDVSGFTHFQFVKITFSLAKDTTDNTKVGIASFNVEGATPVMIVKQNEFGVTYKTNKVTLTDEEIQSGSADLISKSWIISSTSHPFVKIIAKGDYGSAVKRIYLPNYWN